MINRRAFLAATGATGALGLAGRSLARAADGGLAAPRFVFIYTPAGRHPSWRTHKDEKGIVTDFKLGPTMSMFQPYRKRMSILDGFTVVNFGYHINAHWGPLHTMLGGRAPLRRPGDQGGALSVGSQRTYDHLLADRLGRSTPVRNVVLGGRDRDNGAGSNSLMASWIAPETPQHPVHDPDQAFAGLFGGARSDEALAALSSPENIRRAEFFEKEVLGLSQAQLVSFKQRMGTNEARQLEAYEASLRDLVAEVSDRTPLLSASAPMRKSPRLEDLRQGLPEGNEFALHHDTQSRILAAALACGRTRVATYVMAGISSKMTLPGSTNGHHYHNDTAEDHYRIFDAYYGDRVKFLMDELEKYPEGNGTVLDNTVILWTSDIGWTPIEHDHDSIPLYLFGGLPGGRLKLGSYVRVPYDDGGGDRIKALASAKNRRVHEVLLTLGQAAGLRPCEGFADPKYTQGPVTELLSS